MKNIAVINVCNYGSTGKIAIGLHRHLLLEGYNSYFFYGRGKKALEKNTFRIDSTIEVYLHALFSRISGFQGRYSDLATKKMLNFFSKNNIDTIYVVSLHDYFLNELVFWKYVTSKGIKLIYIMIDEYAYLGKCGYSGDCQNYKKGCGHCPALKKSPKSWFFDRTRATFKMKYKYYAQLKDPVFVGPEFVVKNAKLSPIGTLSNLKFCIMDEAIDTSLYKPKNVSDTMKRLNISSNKIVIVCVAPSLYERKGTKYLLEAARKIDDDRFVFIHVGYQGNFDNIPDNYICLGFENNQDVLAEYYSVADVFVFPSLRDTMPNACLESLSCGTPLICFDISGMPYLGDKSVLKLVKTGDVEALIDAIKKVRKKDDNIIKTCRNYALKRYDSNAYFRKLIDLGTDNNE